MKFGRCLPAILALGTAVPAMAVTVAPPAPAILPPAPALNPPVLALSTPVSTPANPALALAKPALAARTAAAPAVPSLKPTTIPAQLDAAARENYRAVFAAIRSGDWSSATARLDAMPDGLLTPIARAELFIAKGSPRADSGALVALVTKCPELPQSGQIARLARTRGAEALPDLPYENDLARTASAPRRKNARSLKEDAAAVALGGQIVPLIKADSPSAAEALLTAAQDNLSPEALTEWRQRVAWSYFLTGDDVSARRLALLARSGPGDWSVQADWVAGLAAWRQKDYAAAADTFASVAGRAGDSEMRAAGLFWAARANMAGGHPDRVQPLLRNASHLTETFYGLLAGSELGLAPPTPQTMPDFVANDWATLSLRPNIRVASALMEIGEPGLADTVLRHQARIGEERDHESLLHLANRLGLPSAQIWLAQHAPAGAYLSASARYPAPAWTPQGGWRVDKSLVFAHALQESQFRADAVSPAGARGLMQILPATAQLIARRSGMTMGSLNDPVTNIAFGQAYLQQLADADGTGGLLPKVIAAYNAGPMAVMKWNDRRRDNGDPLLFIESIPYWETRGYVAIVLRNYWMYQRQAGVKSESLKAIAQGMWPRFPGLPGKTAVRLDTVSGIASAD